MKKKIGLFVVVIIIVTLVAVGGFFLFKNPSTEGFTEAEKQWIDSNKNNVVDIYIPRNIAGLTYMGKGVFFDFVDSMEKQTGLTLKEVAYDAFGDVGEKEYVVEIVDEVKDNQIFILKDNYIVLGKDSHLYTSPEEMKGLKVGVLKENEEDVKKYLENADLEFKVYETESDLNEEFLKEESEIDVLVGLKTLYLDDLLKNDLHVVYHISEMDKSYVITLNGNDTLNSIVKKSYDVWSKQNSDTSYNENLLDTFYEFKGITEKERTTLRDKSYVYGFNGNGAYDLETDGKLTGINYQIVKSFAEFANIDMEYAKEYKNKSELVGAFNSGEVDFYFRNNVHESTVEYYDTVAPIVSKVVLLSDVKNSTPVTSVYSLVGKKVSVVKETKIENYLLQYEIDVEPYDSLEELLKNRNEDSVIAIDLENYEYYKTNALSHFKIDYIFSLDYNYGYTINKNYKLFADLFNFYLEYMPVQDIIHNGYQYVFIVENKEFYYWIAISVLFVLAFVQLVFNIKKILKLFKKKKKKTLTKNEKIRYIDSLTSLRNRAYLNDTIDKWDSSEIYPQVIVIVDLNNIAYINDNFGHEEGDKVITEAANILIQTQMPRSEILRTDGNEFLVYLVEYEEKEVTSYIRKLNKEFKDLSHGFGAAIGSSLITDALKTIDDAINEATLDMRKNKESMISDEK